MHSHKKQMGNESREKRWRTEEASTYLNSLCSASVSFTPSNKYCSSSISSLRWMTNEQDVRDAKNRKNNKIIIITKDLIILDALPPCFYSQMILSSRFETPKIEKVDHN